MEDSKTEFLNGVKNYYNAKFELYGDTPKGVDWNSASGQEIRFSKLMQIIEPTTREFSINDLGCGYGALLDFLKVRYISFKYRGFEISQEMIEVAEKRFEQESNARWFHSAKLDQIADFSVANGIFNVRLDKSDLEWSRYLKTTLEEMDKASKIGFAFNVLSAHSDSEKKRADLYYADPSALSEFCSSKFSNDVTVLDGYGLYEFTILIRKI